MYYSKQCYSLEFKENVFNLPALPADTLLIFTYQQIDSIWKNIPAKFDKMKQEFKKAYDSFGNFHLRKLFPADDVGSESRKYQLNFENDKYYQIDSVSSYFERIDNILSCGFYDNSKPSLIPEALRLYMNFLRMNRFPEFVISSSEYGTIHNDYYIQIYRKNENDKYFTLIKSEKPRNESNNVSFTFYFNFIDSSYCIINEKYSYKACAFAPLYGCYSPFSKPISVLMTYYNKNVLNISEDFSAYPNPAADFIEIFFPDHALKNVAIQEYSNANHTLKDMVDRVAVYDVFGLKIPPRLTSSATTQEGNLRIDVSTLSPGVYFVKVGEKVRKFIKI